MPTNLKSSVATTAGRGLRKIINAIASPLFIVGLITGVCWTWFLAGILAGVETAVPADKSKGKR